MLWMLTLGIAWSGYGDPQDGLPTAAERELHLWTNAVRIDPVAFIDEYPCPFDNFEESEKSPKPPLAHSYGLNEAARFHSQDMHDQGYFSDTSIDGTSFGDRVGRFYEGGYIGENIAMGYPTPYSVMIEGWMCSSGHRANIMLANYEELGAGIYNTYYTQNFGARGIDLAANPIRMGAHSPFNPLGEVAMFADWYDVYGDAPKRMELILNGDIVPMALEWGTPDMGVYRVDLSVEVGPCYTYWFRAKLAGGGVAVFPEDGAYGFGSCDWDDEATQWVKRGSIDVEESEDTIDPYYDADDGILRDLPGPFARVCGHTQAPASGLVALVMLGLIRRRS